MNIFQMNAFASPIGGLIGGLWAAKGLSGFAITTAGIIGLGVGIGLYFGPLQICCLVEKLMRKKNDKFLRSANSSSILIVPFFLYMVMTPYLSFLCSLLLILKIYK